MLVGALLAASCQGADGRDKRSAETSSPMPAPSSSHLAVTAEQPLISSGRVSLAPHGTGTVHVTAADPPTHTWTVRLDVAPPHDLSVVAYTSNGVKLLVLNSITDRDCKRERNRAQCVLQFPLLEAQVGGKWLVEVTNKSSFRITVAVTTTFQAAN